MNKKIAILAILSLLAGQSFANEHHAKKAHKKTCHCTAKVSKKRHHK